MYKRQLLASDVTPFAFWYEGYPEGGCIRFLTETESERLMGLPEGWTKYGADGVEIRPLQRYKALGNAIALPCADYIMAGIYEVLADRAGKEMCIRDRPEGTYQRVDNSEASRLVR